MMANTPADGWDRDERKFLKDFESELDALRARHAQDPHVELLRAAEAEVLPDDLQSAGARYLASDRWSRTLVDSLNDRSLSLDREDESQLLDRIRREAGRASSPRRSWSWLWPSLVAAAAGIVAVIWVTRPSTHQEVAPEAPARQAAVETPRPAPVYALALEKPEIKLSPAALTWRGSGRQGDLAADLKTGLDAFRRDDYAAAERALTDLVTTYPTSVEVFFYLGVSQLSLGETPRALENLTKAAPLADETFASDIAWYRAIADERLGHADAARAGLASLCRGTSPRAQAACAAASTIK
jgi:TolA-binding protein